MKINRPIISVLTGQIQPAFFAPDAGGGGGAAVAEAPPETVEVIAHGEDANAEIMNFEPPDPGAVERAIKSVGEEPPQAGTKKPVEAKASGKPEEKVPTVPVKPADKTKPDQKGEPPVALLRKELETLKTERDELKQRLDAGDPRVKEKEVEITAARTELQQAKERAEELQRQIVSRKAADAPEVKKIEAEYDEKAGNFYDRMASLRVKISQQKVIELVQEMAGIRRGDDNALDAFTQKVNSALGAEEDAQHPQLERTLDFLQETKKYLISRNEKIGEITKNSDDFEVSRAAKHYTGVRSRVDALLLKAREVPDGMAETNPTHPAVVLDKIRKEMGDKNAEFEKGIDEFTRLVVAGTAPRSAKDYVGMTEDQIREARIAEAAKVEQVRDYAVNVLPNGLYALRVLPHLVRELSRLRAKAGEDVEAQPPDPSKSREESKGGEGDELSTFKAPTINDIPEFS